MVSEFRSVVNLSDQVHDIQKDVGTLAFCVTFHDSLKCVHLFF